MIKKIRFKFINLKESFFSGKEEKAIEVFRLVNYMFIGIIFSCICFILFLITILLDIKLLGVTLFVIICAIELVCMFWDKIFLKVMPISSKILLHMFGRYGKVMNKSDWKKIKKCCPEGYKQIFSKKSIGYCYYYSRLIALYLKDAELMYCSIRGENGPTAHCVIVKENYVYCTNCRAHFDYDEYIKMLNVKVYKRFTVEDYRKVNFFDNIRDDFVNWCNTNKVYCDPE